MVGSSGHLLVRFILLHVVLEADALLHLSVPGSAAFLGVKKPNSSLSIQNSSRSSNVSFSLRKLNSSSQGGDQMAHESYGNETANRTAADDKHHQECFSQCSDDGQHECDFCGLHNGHGQYCCREDYDYPPGSNCGRASNWNIDLYWNHHCVEAPPGGKRDINTAIPELFVAVFSARGNSADRRAVRDMWREVDEGAGNTCARFILCQNNNVDGLDYFVNQEREKHGDLLVLDCQEGYAQGLLTLKLLSAIRAYVDHKNDKWSPEDSTCLNKPLFMKTDDDTFVSARKFNPIVRQAVAHYGTSHLYMGVSMPVEAPIRDISHKWYEPSYVFPDANYPRSMMGGPGYIVGLSIMRDILSEGIADSNLLWNEDRAMGVWIHYLEMQGMPANLVGIDGTNGFAYDDPIRSGTYDSYPYALTHHLTHMAISCMTEIDGRKDPYAFVDDCFYSEPLEYVRFQQLRKVNTSANESRF